MTLQDIVLMSQKGNAVPNRIYTANDNGYQRYWMGLSNGRLKEIQDPNGSPEVQARLNSLESKLNVQASVITSLQGSISSLSYPGTIPTLDLADINVYDGTILKLPDSAKGYNTLELINALGQSIFNITGFHSHAALM